MKRNVYFDGELAEKYGEVISVNAKSVADIVKLIQANDPTFKNYIVKCADKGISFSVEVQNETVKEEDLILPLKEGDVYFSVVPAGSKSGGGKILAAVAIAGLFLLPGGAAIGLGAVNATGASVAIGSVGSVATLGGSTALYSAVSSLAINLAITGLQQLMAPDPSTDDGPESYLFNSSNQNIVEGDPMPLAYGRVRVPGRAISFAVMNENTYNSSIYSYASALSTGAGGGESGFISSYQPETEDESGGILGGILVSDSDGSLKTIPTPKEALE